MATTAVLVVVLLALGAYGVVILAREAPRPLWPPREPDRIVGRDEAGWKRRRDRIGRGWAMVVVAVVLLPITAIWSILG